VLVVLVVLVDVNGVIRKKTAGGIARSDTARG